MLTAKRGLLALCLLLAMGVGPAPAADAPLPEREESDIGYPSVMAALGDLRARPGVELSDQNGWTIAAQKTEGTIWSFAPKGHAVYPAVVRRRLIRSRDGIALRMDVLCEASKAACDQLVREFTALNEAASKRLRR